MIKNKKESMTPPLPTPSATSAASAAFTLHTSFSPLLPLYHTFLLDQYGVLHNGSKSLYGAVECIQSMLQPSHTRQPTRKTQSAQPIEPPSDQPKKLAILSNTSSPSHIALKRLPKYNLTPEMFEGGLVSSGEECARFVRENYCSGTKYDNGSTIYDKDGGSTSMKTNRKTKKALWFTWKESESQNPLGYLSHCEGGIGGIGGNGGDAVDAGDGSGGSIEVAESVQEADFILLQGCEVWRRCRESVTTTNDAREANDWIQDLNYLHNQDFSIIDPLLKEASERELPMVCANPDLTVVVADGAVLNMPGRIAQRYQKLGGTVHSFGKPNPHHFHACLDNLNIPYKQYYREYNKDGETKIPGVAHVGDSLEHDIVGANAAGIDSIFVLGGIHAKDLGLIPTGSDGLGIEIVEDAVDDDDDKVGDNDEEGLVNDAKKIRISKKKLERKLEDFFKEKGIWPTHVIPSLHLDGA